MIVRDESRVPEFLKMWDELRRTHIEIGILGEDKGGKKHDDSDMTVLAIAIINEYGLKIEVTEKMRNYLHYMGIHLKASTKHINIPERAFIRGGIDSNMDKIQSSGEKELIDVINLKTPVDIFFKTLGELIVGMIQEYMIDLREPPNHPATIAGKRGGTNPLMGKTGQLLGSITYKVVKN